MGNATLQSWTNATWQWDSAVAGSACVELVAELDAWISAINGNASQTGKHVVKIRDYNSSTTVNYRGWGVQLPMQNQVGDLYVRVYSSSTATNLSYVCSTGFTDDTSNGGYGGATGTTGSDTGISWKNTVTTSGTFIIGTSTVDGEEFFGYGWSLDNSSTYADFVLMFKDDRGEWSSFVADGGAMSGLAYDDLRGAWTNIAGFESTSNTNTLLPLSVYTTSTPVANNEQFRYRINAASDDLSYTVGSSLVQSSYTTLPGGDNAVLMSQYGAFVRYTPV